MNEQVQVGQAAAKRATGLLARLRVSETFVSIQGEADAVGWPTAFIRLTGCPLRCVYCDTAYAFHGGDWHSVAEMVDFARQSGARHVCVTGGEPLAQRSCHDLLRSLCDAGFVVSLETGGAIDIDGVDPRVARVVDVKTPGSGEQARNRESNLDVLTSRDQVKFVLCSRGDYEWARELIRSRIWPCQVLLSPVWGQLEPRELAEWMLADRLPVRLQVQLHKYLWGGAAGR